MKPGFTLTVLFFLALVPIALRGQDSLGAVIQELNGPELRMPLGQHAYIADIPASRRDAWLAAPLDTFQAMVDAFPDPTDLTTLTISPSGDTRWRKNTTDKLFLNAPSRLSWIIIDLAYTGTEAKTFMLDLTGIDGISWFYRDHQGNPVSFADSFGEPQGGRPVFNTKTVMPLSLQPDQDYRLHIAAYTVTDAKYATADLWEGEAFRAQKLHQHIIDGAYFGLALALILYNLFLFAALKRYTHLFFSLFVAGSAGMIYVGSGLSLVFGLQNTFTQALPLAYAFQGLILLAGALFSMSLLNIKNTNRFLYYVWITIILLDVILIPAIVIMARGGGYSPIDVGITFDITVFLWLAHQCANIGTIACYWNKSSMARYWFLAITLHTWALAIWPIILNSSINFPFPPYHLAQFATLFDTVLLSALIAFNFRSEHRKAKEKSIENLRIAHSMEKAKTDFINTVSHDLQSPVQAIRHFMVSLRYELPGTAHKTLNKIDDNLTNITELLDSMVELSHSQWRAMHPRMEAVDLARLFPELKAEFSARAAEKNLSLQFDESDSHVLSDRIGLGQILRNLVDNAIKYTQNGYVNVAVEEAPESVTIRVKDSGRGIPKHELETIFNDFYRIDTDGENIAGIGLGLSIVSRLTKLLGIDMQVSSDLHSGSCFELKIGRAAVEA